MKKEFTRKAIALVGCVAFVFAACILFCTYHDVLAGAALWGALCFSVLWNTDNHNTLNTLHDERD